VPVVRSAAAVRARLRGLATQEQDSTMQDEEAGPEQPERAPLHAVDLHVETGGDAIVLHVAGEVDASVRGALAAALRMALARAGDVVVVDLSRCSFIDHRAIDAIDAAAGSLRARGAQLVVRDPPPSFMLVESLIRGPRSFVTETGPPSDAAGGASDSARAAGRRRERRPAAERAVGLAPRAVGRPSKYASDVRAEAVRQVVDLGRRIQDVARDLGVASVETVRYWVKEEVRQRTIDRAPRGERCRPRPCGDDTTSAALPEDV
jgi:anti-anti-sigma factor